MSLMFLLKVITSWELLLISGILLLLIPLVSYLASVRPRHRRRGFVPPADRALMEPRRGPVES